MGLSWTWRRRTAAALAAPLFLGLFVISAIMGPAASYLALLSALAGAIMLTPSGFRAALADWSIRANLFGFGLLAIAFALSAQAMGDLAAVGDFAVMLIAIPAFVLVRGIANVRAGLILACLSWIGAVVTVIAGINDVYVLHLGRAQGGFSAIYYSDIGVALGFLAALGILVPGPRWRWALLSGPILGIAAIQLGGTRGALLGACVFGALLTTGAFYRWPKQRKFVLAGIISAGALVLSVATLVDASRLLQTPQLMWESLSGQTSDWSLNMRLQFYSGGIRAFLDSPIFGHGWWQRFTAAVPYMSPEAAAMQTVPGVSHLHNDLINFASAAGILGIAACLLFLFGPLVSAFRSTRDSQYTFRVAAVASMSLGFFTFGLSDSVFVFEVGKTFYVLSVIAILGFCRDEPLRS